MALAGIGELPGTLHDRSIVIRLERALPGEIQEPFNSRKISEGKSLCRKLSRWAQDYAVELEQADPDIPGLFNRQADNWRPLIAIADVVGGKWPERARYLARNFNLGDETENSGVILLGDIKKVFEESGYDKLFYSRSAGKTYPT